MLRRSVGGEGGGGGGGGGGDYYLINLDLSVETVCLSVKQKL